MLYDDLEIGPLHSVLMKSCIGCEFYHSDSGFEVYWYICTHPIHGEDGRILPNKKGDTPKWCPLNSNPSYPLVMVGGAYFVNVNQGEVSLNEIIKESIVTGLRG